MLNNSSNDNFKVLFIGDIVGRAGRMCTKRFLLDENNKKDYDIVIANVENASHGFGLTKRNHDEILSYGVDIMTSGNHIWDKKDILQYIEESNNLIRPYNYPNNTPGVGYRIFNDKIVIINMLGKTFMPPVKCPFEALEDLFEEQRENFKDKIILIDFHAEATAEKQCFARFALDFGVSALIGTHTHIQTADEEIIENLAYLSDVGSCSSTKGVIGMDYNSSLKKITSPINERFEVEMALPYKFNALEITFCGKIPTKLNRVNKIYETFEEVKNEN